MNFTRRRFIQGLGALGATTFAPGMRVAFANESDAAASDVLVHIFLRGAADGLNMVVPHGDADYYAARPTIAIPAPDGGEGATIDLDGFFGLSPELAPLHSQWAAGNLAIIHATGSPDDSHSHFDAQDAMDRGVVSDKSETSGWISRFLDQQTSSSAFLGTALSSSVPKSLQGPVQGVSVDNFDGFELTSRYALSSELETLLGQMYASNTRLDSNAQATLQAMQELRSTAPGAIPVDHSADYGASSWGEALMATAQLIKSDIGAKAIALDFGGWDTHDGQAQELAGLNTDLAQSLSAFATDMGDNLQQVTVVVQTEFGRRVEENASLGTDHGHGSIMLVLGGGIIGGRVYGQWPGLNAGALYGPGDLEITTDYRTVLGEVIAQRLGGGDLSLIFPNYTMPAFVGFTG